MTESHFKISQLPHVARMSNSAQQGERIFQCFSLFTLRDEFTISQQENLETFVREAGALSAAAWGNALPSCVQAQLCATSFRMFHIYPQSSFRLENYLKTRSLPGQ